MGSKRGHGTALSFLSVGGQGNGNDKEPGVLNFDIWRMVPNQGSLNKEVVIEEAWNYGEYSVANFHASGGNTTETWETQGYAWGNSIKIRK